MESVNYINNRSTSRQGFRKLSMAILATLPLLAWYKIPFPVDLGLALVLFLSAYTIVIRSFKIDVFAPMFWFLFVYICFMWMYNNGFGLKTLIPPGGWQFFLFFLAIIWGVLNYDMRLLLKYMRWVVIISAFLFWIQLILKLATGSQMFCFVPNLTGAFTYEGMTYSELAAHQLNDVGRPCSIFLEPSYMAYYYITYLALSWFGNSNNEKWLTKETVFLIITLVALQSGSGMVGLTVIVIAKLLTMFWSGSLSRKLMLLVIAVPLLAGSVYLYLGTEMGQKMFSRADEFTIEGSSGFNRVVAGYLMFDQMDFNEQLIGIPDASDRFGIEQADGKHVFYVNGVQSILLSLGYVGAALYLIFYIGLFRKVSSASRMCIIVLLVMGLLESNYLNPNMMQLTIIPCAEYYYRKKSIAI
jgi:hypothetical protein